MTLYHWINICIVFLLPVSVLSIRCGVCSSGGPGSGLAALKAQFSGLGNIPECGTGSGEDQQPLVLDCPRDFHAGCLTQTRGKHVSKMCSNIPVQDCKSANGVEYCYCRGEMCNIRDSSPPAPPPVQFPPPAQFPPAPTQHHLTTAPSAPAQRMPAEDPNDDEDVGEGSGAGTLTKFTTKSPADKPKSATKAPSSSNNAAISSLSWLCLILYISLIAQY